MHAWPGQQAGQGRAGGAAAHRLAAPQLVELGEPARGEHGAPRPRRVDQLAGVDLLVQIVLLLLLVGGFGGQQAAGGVVSKWRQAAAAPRGGPAGAVVATLWRAMGCQNDAGLVGSSRSGKQAPHLVLHCSPHCQAAASRRMAPCRCGAGNAGPVTRHGRCAGCDGGNHVHSVRSLAHCPLCCRGCEGCYCGLRLQGSGSQIGKGCVQWMAQHGNDSMATAWGLGFKFRPCLPPPAP